MTDSDESDKVEPFDFDFDFDVDLWQTISLLCSSRTDYCRVYFKNVNVKVLVLVNVLHGRVTDKGRTSSTPKTLYINRIHCISFLSYTKSKQLFSRYKRGRIKPRMVDASAPVGPETSLRNRLNGTKKRSGVLMAQDIFMSKSCASE